MHRDRGAGSYRSALQPMLPVVDHRLLGDPVDRKGDLVPDAPRHDLDAPLLAAQRERHCHDRSWRRCPAGRGLVLT